MNNEIDEYTKGQNDMLALIKEIYYTSSKKEFEKFLGKDDLDANEVLGYLREKYMKLGKKQLIDSITKNLGFKETIDMEFVGYVVKIGNCYLKDRLNLNYTICTRFLDAKKITSLNYAKKVAEETGGVVKHLYVSDKKLDEYKE